MHRQGVPLHVRWSIDVDPDCWEMQQCSDPCRSQVQSLRDLDLVPTEHQASFHICADVLWGWWVRVLGRFPVQALCVSSPCQPWSRAGGGSGLESTDGQLLLRVADLAAAFEVPVVLIEQVEHFPQHAHFPQVLQAWQQCGYEVCWCRQERKRLRRHQNMPRRNLAAHTWLTALGSFILAQRPARDHSSRTPSSGMSASARSSIAESRLSGRLATNKFLRRSAILLPGPGRCLKRKARRATIAKAGKLSPRISLKQATRKAVCSFE